ncbi:MAG: SDR family oxidoreductase [Desulfobulbaceae bacterium]|nr:SDR family oxidoreductase [Desulfobulbaceae bacterium]
MKKNQEHNIPMGRYGEPEEVAKVILSMVESSYVTGTIWRVDDGVTA